MKIIKKLLYWVIAAFLGIQAIFELTQIHFVILVAPLTDYNNLGDILLTDVNITLLLTQGVLPVGIVILLSCVLFLYLRKNPKAVWVYVAAICGILLKYLAFQYLASLYSEMSPSNNIATSPSLYLTNVLMPWFVPIARVAPLFLVLYFMHKVLGQKKNRQEQ